VGITETITSTSLISFSISKEGIIFLGYSKKVKYRGFFLFFFIPSRISLFTSHKKTFSKLKEQI